MAAHALLETARDALFLARLAPSRLAWVYLAIAVVSLALFVLQERSRIRSGRGALAAWLAGSAVVDMLLWSLITPGSTWTLYALYTWSGVFASLVVVRFWILLGDLFSISQAKRVFAFIGAGGGAGAIVGSLLARALTMPLEPVHLLPASAVLLLVTAAATRALLPRSVSTAVTEAHVEEFNLYSSLNAIWLRPYLRRVAAIGLLSAVTLTLVDFLFKSIVAARVPMDQLGSFFASTYVVLNTLSFGAQLLVVSWLIRRLSVNRVLSVLPALVVAATTAIAFGGGLIAGLALKGFDGVLRHSLHRTAMEVLYVPLTGGLRARTKGIIDVLGQRGGQALASVFILLAAVLGNNIAIVSAVVIVLAIAWIRVAATVEAHYLDLFREALSGVATRTRMDFPEMDLASLETLLTHLNSEDDSQVIAALDMFQERERVHLIPALILYHPSSTVVLRVLELFTLSGRQDFLGILGRLLKHDDPDVRAASLRAHTWAFGPREDLYKGMSEDTSPIVRATALIGLVSYSGAAIADLVRSSLESFPVSGSREERLALARAIRYSPGAAHGEILCQLAESGDVDVRIAAVQAMREVLSARFIPILLRMLPIRVLRKEARATLVSIGTEALARLDEALGDPHADPDIRLHAPRTIGFFPARSATEVLMRHLAGGLDGALTYRILRALGRCRAADPEAPLDAEVLRMCLEQTMTDAFRILDQQVTMARGAAAEPGRATPVHGLIVDLLQHRRTMATERLFRLVGLLYPGEDVRSLYRGVHDASSKVRDSSRELLDHVLEPPLQGAVLALVDDIDDAARLARAGSYYVRPGLDYVGTLGELLDQRDVGTVSLAAYQAGEIAAAELEPRLRRLQQASSDVAIVTAVGNALARIDREATAHGS